MDLIHVSKIFSKSNFSFFILPERQFGKAPTNCEVKLNIVGVSDVSPVSDKGVPEQILTYLISC
jgi:hypothetical protein